MEAKGFTADMVVDHCSRETTTVGCKLMGCVQAKWKQRSREQEEMGEGKAGRKKQRSIAPL